MQIVVNKILTNYTDRGAGEVVLLLHGWGSNSAMMDDLAGDLVAKYRVIAVDFPGFGGSSEPETAWTVADYAKF
ncbi:alpha/beta fold hydrolase, partial [Candidatus Saccharibacteria bacterium]|nr:alpha/beta fold hydrolase [Candidatus Saccharibacteria bacterium]